MPPDDFGPTDYPDADATPENASNSLTQTAPEVATVESVLASWRVSGPLIHESTGIPRLDELTGGGPIYGTRWYLSGAPDGGKTALLVHLAHLWAERGIYVGVLAVDEEPTDLVTRLVQRKGFPRHDAELRDPATLDAMEAALRELPMRFYDADWTIEAAGAHIRQTAGGGRAVLLIDSIQTVRCTAEMLAEREMTEVAAVTARTKAVRSVATRFNLIVIATSELGRSSYATEEARRTVSTLAGAKWSGAIEYSARVLIGLRSVGGEKDLIDLEIAKNKHGASNEHVFLRIDRPSQSLWETDYQAPPELDRSAAAVERGRADALTVAAILRDHPGIGVRDLYTKAKAVGGLSKERANVALEVLGDAVVRTSGPKNSTPMTLDESKLQEGS